MPRRSLHEDTLMVGALHLHMESGIWTAADLPESVELITNGEVIAQHIAARVLRRARDLDWVTTENELGGGGMPRLLYRLTEDQGVPTALTAAGRELAAGKLYPLPILTAFGQTALGQTMVCESLVNEEL